MASTPNRQRARPLKQRQRTGKACEECRRRKLRCDAAQPRCGACVESGVPCEVNSLRQPRGPKKGYLKALRNRVGIFSMFQNFYFAKVNLKLPAMLETHLPPQHHAGALSELKTLSTPFTDNHHDSSSVSSASSCYDSNSPSLITERTAARESTILKLNGTSTCSPQSVGMHGKDMGCAEAITELMQAELNQLYFDRVHPSVQILHQLRYIGWARKPVKKTSRRCLQYAIWTLASLLSAQFQHLQDFFYQETKRTLEHSSLSGDSNNLVDTEEIQAWILIAIYESMRTLHRRAWMSAGRAFRLVQLRRLHEIDSPTKPKLPDEDFIETEEKRRVFWMAYFLDHLFSMRNNWPITLNEHVICTRLPAPDKEFQSGQAVLGAFLSEAIMDVMPQTTSPFNECIILATICGRSLFQAQQCGVRFVYGDLAPNWTDQHRWLDNVLTNRLQVLLQYYPSPSQICDPMLSFAHIMGQASVIHLYKGMESVAWAVNEAGWVVEYKRHALNAAQEIYVTPHGDPGLEREYLIRFRKIHPLMPIPLLLCAEFLYANRESDAAFDSLLQELLQIFRQLKNANDPTQSYIHLLGLSCTAASIDLVKGSSTAP
ncbi:hypothetical protein N7507_009362 [Penicillium longicatenatum]|nr:hypothetical protein N7507_009362 [Penicillium longicatenatum]